MSALQAAVTDRLVECQRNRSRRCVAMAIDGDDDPIAVESELPAGRIDDADIGLMRNQPISPR